MISSAQPWDDHERVVNVLRKRLKNVNECGALIDSYGELMISIWSFTARLFGDRGTAAVVARSVSVAARQSPLIGLVKVENRGVDMMPFKLEVLSRGCTDSDVMDAIIHFGAVIFETLAELTGDALTEPLLKQLEGEKD